MKNYIEFINEHGKEKEKFCNTEHLNPVLTNFLKSVSDHLGGFAYQDIENFYPISVDNIILSNIHKKWIDTRNIDDFKETPEYKKLVSMLKK